MSVRASWAAGACAVAAAAGLAVAESVADFDPAAFAQSRPKAAAVLTNHFIRVDASGRVDTAFDAARAIFCDEGAFQTIQAEYARMLPEGETPEFVVQRISPTDYYYVNRKGQRSEVTELYRRGPTDTDVEVVYHVKGRRFFGGFQALVRVVVSKRDAGGLEWRAAVFAYPESAAPRFFARHLGIVGRYFRSKTDDVSELFIRIGRRLCDPAAATPAARAPAAAPQPDQRGSTT
jgi:hypothetical protein